MSLHIGRSNLPQAPRWRNVELPPSSPTNGNSSSGGSIGSKPTSPASTVSTLSSLYSMPSSSVLNEMLGNSSPFIEGEGSLSTSPMDQRKSNVPTFAVTPLKGILKNSTHMQNNLSPRPNPTGQSSQRPPMRSILKSPGDGRLQEDFLPVPTNTPATQSPQTLASARARVEREHEENRSGGPNAKHYPASITALGMAPIAPTPLKAEVISLNWMLIYQDRNKKRPTQYQHLEKGFDMGRREGVWVYDHLQRRSIDPVSFLQQPASIHCDIGEMRIVASWNEWWQCTVYPTGHNSSVSCADIFGAIFRMLQEPLTASEFPMDSRFTSRIRRAREQRLRRNSRSSSQYLRIDVLGEDKMFKGLRQVGSHWLLDRLDASDLSHPTNGATR